MRKRTVVAAIALAFALTSCSSSTADEADPVEAEKSETQKESEAIPKSERGNIVKQVGETAELRNSNDELLASLTITSIEVDPVCTQEGAMPAENGHLVAVGVDFESTAAYETGTMILGPWGIKAIDDQGVTMNGDPESNASMSCISSDEFVNRTPDPGEHIVGTVMLDVPTSSGVLVFNDMWEWEYPAA